MAMTKEELIEECAKVGVIVPDHEHTLDFAAALLQGDVITSYGDRETDEIWVGPCMRGCCVNYNAVPDQVCEIAHKVYTQIKDALRQFDEDMSEEEIEHKAEEGGKQVMRKFGFKIKLTTMN
jgi:hypothetical protein